ncbi:TPA: hypothetical protein ACSTJ0_003730 [Serratia fonticola]
MELYNIFPKNEVFDYFNGNVIVNTYGIEDINEIIKLKPDSVFQTGGRSWDRYVHMNDYKNPKLLKQHFINRNPLLYKEVERVVGERCLNDISYVNAVVSDPELPDPMSAELLIASIYPNELHIADIQLLDPYQPINPQKYDFQPYKGLGILNIVIDNCIKYCLENKIGLLTLVAANKELISVFERHGFNVENSPSGKLGMQLNMSIPMVLEIPKG